MLSAKTGFADDNLLFAIHHYQEMQLEIFVNSDVGRVRRGNEDNFLLLNLDSERFELGGKSQVSAGFQNLELRDAGLVLAVADGMGGALAGEVASMKAVETVRDILLGNDIEITLAPDDNQSLIERLNRATIHANTSIYLQGRSDAQYNGMGSTFTAATLTKNGVDFLQVGDSRAYVIRGAVIEQVTKDQSLVQQLIDSGQITPEEAETHSLRNVILQALGAQSDVVPVAVSYKPSQNDILLLCSDGLSNKLGKQDLLEIVTEFSADLKRACVELVKEANNRGGEDNITVILARFTGEDLPDDPQAISIEKLIFDDDTSEIPTQVP